MGRNLAYQQMSSALVTFLEILTETIHLSLTGPISLQRISTSFYVVRPYLANFSVVQEIDTENPLTTFLKKMNPVNFTSSCHRPPKKRYYTSTRCLKFYTK